MDRLPVHERVSALRQMPSVADDRRGRRLREKFGLLIAHAERYHRRWQSLLPEHILDAADCPMCFGAMVRCQTAMRPGYMRVRQMAYEGYLEN